MFKFAGLPLSYIGIAMIGAGTWIHKGLDAGLIASGLCLIISGSIQYLIER